MSEICEFKERCGSCSWSDLPYQAQLAKKLSEINQTFAENKLELQCDQIVASPLQSHYRNRMDYAIDFEGRLGLREKGKWWRVIDGHKCFLADRKIEAIFEQVRAWIKTCGLSFFDRKSKQGLLRYALIRASTLGEALLCIVSSQARDESEEEQALQALQVLAGKLSGVQLVWGINNTPSDTSFSDELRNISGAGQITEQIKDWRYLISTNSFFQTNSHAAHDLLETVLEFAGDLREKRVLDLFCGSGFFSIPLATLAKNVLGVELNPDAIKDAELNAKLNKSLAAFSCMKSEELKLSDLSSDLIVLDPPRAGLHPSLLKQLQEPPTARLIYVSCNYKSFAKEMLLLKNCYQLEKIRAVDLFPHTPHVELVAMLRALPDRNVRNR